VKRGWDQVFLPLVIWRGSPPLTLTTNNCESVKAKAASLRLVVAPNTTD
jgi:hypothetical protein